MLQYVDHNHHDVIFCQGGGGGGDGFVWTLEAQRGINIIFVLLKEMFLDKNQGTCVVWGGGGGGGGRDSIVSTLEALRVISINFVLVISMIIDNHHDAFFFWVGGGGGQAGGWGGGDISIVSRL